MNVKQVCHVTLITLKCSKVKCICAKYATWISC